MTRAQILELFADQQRYWDKRDADGLSRCHTENGRIESPIFRTVRGREAILTSYRTLFQIFPDWKYDSEELLVDGERVAQPFSVTATHVGEFMGMSGTGRKTDFNGIRLFEMKDGLIEYERRYYDFTGLLIQLGVLRSKPARD